MFFQLNKNLSSIRKSSELENSRRKLFNLFLLTLLLINISTFIIINTKTISWRQNEITHFNFFWSMSGDQIEPFILRSQMHKNDLLKIFNLGDMENHHLRFRQFSNLSEMLSFKFWQNLGINTFHNYTLICLHIINVILLWFLIKSLSNNPLAATACSFLLLNSGAAISTLLFPSRIQKILLITLFLSAWITQVGIKNTSNYVLRNILFYIFVMLMFFTDEQSFLLISLLFVLIFLKNKNSQTLKKLFIYSVLFVTSYLVLRCFFTFLSIRLFNYKDDGFFSDELHRLLIYFRCSSFVHDTGNAFINYFLRRNFGYWDHSFWGLSSLIAFLFLLLSMLKINLKSSHLPFFLIIFFILIKAVLLPHPYGIHKAIMGANTEFPTLLFFNYYYTYIDITLLIIAFSFLLTDCIHSRKLNSVLMLLAISIMGISNALHANEGIKDAILQHSYYQTGNRNLNKIVSLHDYCPLTRYGSIYLSFPSGSQPIFKRFPSTETEAWKMDPQAKKQNLLLDFFDYGSILLPQYLKLIEEKKFIVSLQNISSMSSYKNGNELLSARYFYDVHQNIFLDLDKIKKLRHSLESTQPIVSAQRLETLISINSERKTEGIIFFVKGGADISLKTENEEIQTKQDYGFSYKIFNVPLNMFKNLNINSILLTIKPFDSNPNITLWGPFIQSKEPSKIENR